MKSSWCAVLKIILFLSSKTNSLRLDYFHSLTLDHFPSNNIFSLSIKTVIITDSFSALAEFWVKQIKITTREKITIFFNFTMFFRLN